MVYLKDLPKTSNGHDIFVELKRGKKKDNHQTTPKVTAKVRQNLGPDMTGRGIGQLERREDKDHRYHVPGSLQKDFRTEERTHFRREGGEGG